MSPKPEDVMRPYLCRESIEKAQELMKRPRAKLPPRDYSFPEFNDPNYVPSFLKVQAC